MASPRQSLGLACLCSAPVFCTRGSKRLSYLLSSRTTSICVHFMLVGCTAQLQYYRVPHIHMHYLPGLLCLGYEVKTKSALQRSAVACAADGKGHRPL